MTEETNTKIVRLLITSNIDERTVECQFKNDIDVIRFISIVTGFAIHDIQYEIESTGSFDALECSYKELK